MNRPSTLLPSALLSVLLLATSGIAASAPTAAARPQAAAPVGAPSPARTAAPVPARKPVPMDYRLEVVVTVDATQDWVKNDPKHPGEQFSKAVGKQRWEVSTTLRSNGVLEVRDLLDADLDTRLEAKIIHLARQAKKAIEARGGKFEIPTTPEQKQALDHRHQYDLHNCLGEPNCKRNVEMEYAALYAVIEYPEALQEDEVPGQYLYFEPFGGCPSKSRIQMSLDIQGRRWNKDVDKFVDFSELRRADEINGSDGTSICNHYLIVLDTFDQQRPMRVENVFFPSVVGVTEYTERGRSQKTTESQPMPGAVMEWVDKTLRQGPMSGSASADLPLSISLNGISTWLGKWTGTAKTTLTWRFVPVTAVTKP